MQSIIVLDNPLGLGAPEPTAGSPRECKCHCSKNPTSCFKKNKILAAGSILFANKHEFIKDIHECSDLCANHPDCKSWEYNTNKTCVLNDAEPVYAPNDDSAVTTWAGGKSGPGACVVRGFYQICMPGEYRVPRLDHGDNSSVCKPCPAGYMSHKSNAYTCDLVPKVTYSIRSGCPSGYYIALGVMKNGFEQDPYDPILQPDTPMSEIRPRGSYTYNCAKCPPGEVSSFDFDRKCHQHYKTGDLATGTPTMYPTLSPTLTASERCVTECVNTNTMPQHSTLAPCLACKAKMSVEDFCVQYGTPNGVGGC